MISNPGPPAPPTPASTIPSHQNPRQLQLIVVSPWLLVVLLCLGGGCQRAPSLSGIVTYDGQPVEKGAITLTPADGKGPTVGSDVAQGKYHIDAVPPGKKIVQIVSVKEAKMAMSSAEMAQQAADKPRGIPENLDLIPSNAIGNNQSIIVDANSSTLDFELRHP